MWRVEEGGKKGKGEEGGEGRRDVLITTYMYMYMTHAVAHLGTRLPSSYILSSQYVPTELD